jgi:CHASE3 domain sensor protein
MPTEPATAQSSERFSFRRLIRYSIGLQVFVIAVLLGATLWGALQTREKSEDLARETKNVLLLTGVNQEFERARVALRQYVRSGSGFSLGALSQSRKQISIISPILEAGLPASSRQMSEQLTDQQLAYLKIVGDKAVVRVRRGDLEGANAALTSPEAFAQLNQITRSNKNLSDDLAERQASADQAVSRRQELNALLIVLSGLIILGTGIGVLLWIRSETMVPLENLAVGGRPRAPPPPQPARERSR